MDENMVTQTEGTDTAAVVEAAQTPAVTPGNTPPQVASVDEAAIIAKAESKAMEAAEKKMEGVFKSMLAQQGLDAETITKMTDKWKEKQRTPETDLQEAREALAAEQAKNQALERRTLARDRNVPAEKVDKYVKLAESYMSEDVDFAAALDLALADFPIAQGPPPVYAAGTGSQPLNGKPDEWAKRIAKYQ